MLYYDRIDVSKRTDVIKDKQTKRVWYLPLLVFLDKGFKFQPYGHNGCHDVLMTSMNLSNIAILHIHGVDYLCIISRIIKSE